MTLTRLTAIDGAGVFAKNLGGAPSNKATTNLDALKKG